MAGLLQELAMRKGEGRRQRRGRVVWLLAMVVLAALIVAALIALPGTGLHPIPR